MSSGLELYQSAIVEAARRLTEHPRLAEPVGTATLDNPLCGDRVTTDVELSGGALVRVGQRVRGCLLCEASATLLAELAAGCDAPAVAALEEAVERLLAESAWEPPGERFEPFSVFAPVAAVPSRHRCVTLPFESLAAALRDASTRY